MSLWTSRSGEFQHEALFYATQGELIRQVADFVADGLVRGEPSVVALSRTKLRPLREVLGGEQPGVRFIDMDLVGRNPAHLIPAYRDVIDELAPSGRSRGVGEPVHPGRRGAALVECQVHESLCNVAYLDRAWWVICPYDTSTLAPEVLDEARRSHPLLVENGVRSESGDYRDVALYGPPIGNALAAPPPSCGRLEWTSELLGDGQGPVRDKLRALIAGEADPDLAPGRVDALAAAAGDLLGEGRRQGPGATARVWRSDDAVVVEVQLPYGELDPLVGRRPPAGCSRRSAIFNAANQASDLFQVRSEGTWTAVRLHVRM